MLGELWSLCAICGEPIRLLDREWHHPEPGSHGAELEDLERAATGTADNRWRIPRMNGPRIVYEARHMARL